MKTFIIKELRRNEKGEAFEVKTKVQFRSIGDAIKYLEDNPVTLWNGKYAIEEEGHERRRTWRTREMQKAQIRTSGLNGEEGDI